MANKLWVQSDKMKSRLDDVARLAGVGIATVDRVLNERGNVSTQTARRVIEAAKKLELARKLPQPYRRLIRVEVILPARNTSLIRRLASAFEVQIAITSNVFVIERTFLDNKSISELPNRIRGSKSDALIIFGEDNPAMAEAISVITSSGVPVITIGSDLPATPRLSYVGIDHFRAGRTAAFFMTRMAGHGLYLIACNNLRYRSEALRVSGFRDGINSDRDLKRRVEIEIVEGDAAFEATFGASRRIMGIYNCGSEHWLPSVSLSRLQWRPIVIGHDLGPEVHTMLESGAMTLAIDQNPELQAERCISILRKRFEICEEVPTTGVVPFTLHTRENI